MGAGVGKRAAEVHWSTAQQMAFAWLITIPASFSRAEQIKIEAVPGQEDMDSEVCVLYNDHVAKKLSFDDREETTVEMNDNGTCGC